MALKNNLVLENVSLTYAAGLKAVEGISFALESGAAAALVGPSGCGKSTLLNLVAGLLTPSSGVIRYGDESVRAPSRERSLIFQGHALFPWLTARGNIEFALEAAGGDAKRAESFLKQVGLEGFGDYLPHRLSGGMRQRVGIARALAADARLLLLDEPFASLDVINRESVLKELLKQKFAGTGLLLVTHDIEEAVYVSDQIHLLSGRPGVIKKSIPVSFAKPSTLREMKRMSEYARIEDEIHDHLSQHS